MKRYQLFFSYGDDLSSLVQEADNLTEFDLAVLKPLAQSEGYTEWVVLDQLTQKVDRTGKFEA